MALRATVYKVELQLADIDRGHYHRYPLTLARHPSETEERLMVRLIAFALFADGALAFGAGLSDADEPDLWQRDLTGAIELWIEVGLPDEKRIRRACGRAAHVVVLAYGGGKAAIWWRQNAPALARCGNLSVFDIDADASESLARLAHRSLDAHCTIEQNQVLFGTGDDSVQFEVKALQGQR
jgi:uncharacterized protein YaeQ